MAALWRCKAMRRSEMFVDVGWCADRLAVPNPIEREGSTYFDRFDGGDLQAVGSTMPALIWARAQR